MGNKARSLSDSHPELAAQAEGWDPRTVTAGSQRRLSWKCNLGHRWTATVGSRSAGSNCPVCANRVVLPGFNDLATTHPQIATQADGWDPASLTAGSNQRRTWKCDCGFQWVAAVADVTNGTRCPVCFGKTVRPGFNDLATTHPELATQAFKWDPSTLRAFSNKKVSWKCSEGHVWLAVVSSRTQGNGCPYCAGLLATPGTNDLATTHPDLAAQAHGWDPTTLKQYSNKKVEWKCDLGHHWTATVGSRVQGSGCPYCSGREPIVGITDLASRFPALAAQAHGWDPTTVTSKSGRKLRWACEFGHQWDALVSNRVQGRGCPICANKMVLPGFNDIATTHPDLAAEADGWDPTTLTAGSGARVTWKCASDHTWVAPPSYRLSGTGCPVCAGRSVLKGFNDVATTHPLLATQADGWDPTSLTAGAGQKVSWICAKRHRWIAAVSSRSSGTGCPVCVGQAVGVNENDFASEHPDIACEADGWEPSTVVSGSGLVVSRKCELGHQWRTAVKNRSRGSGCPICTNRVASAGFNDLATTHPAIAVQADGWDPTTVTAGSQRKLPWKCGKGHRWAAVVGSRLAGSDCPVCANRVALPGINDLSTTHPELASQADGWDPTTLTSGSSKKVGWRCSEGHKWTAVVHNRSKGVGCPSCAAYGYDPNRQGWLYLIDHDNLELIQIGISNVPSNRLASHARRGWEVLDLRGPMDGHLTSHLETAILRAVEKRGASLANKVNIEKFDGFTEAWTKSSLSVTSLRQLLEWVYEDESQI